MSYQFNWRENKQRIAMAEKVGRIKDFKFMAKTSLIHVEERETIGICEVYKIINPGDTAFLQYLDKVVIPSLTAIGRARWFRDTITDLAFALSNRTTQGGTGDLGDILNDFGETNTETPAPNL